MPQRLARIDHLLSWLHLDRLFLGRHKLLHFRIWYRDALSEYVRQMLLDPVTLSRPYVEKKGLVAIVRDRFSFVVTAKRLQQCRIGVAPLLLIEQAFFSANILKLLEAAGADPKHVAIGHVCCLDDVKAEIPKQLAKRGVFVGFDRVTLQIVPDAQKVTTILAFLDADDLW